MKRMDDVDLDVLDDEQSRAAQAILDGPRGSLDGPFWPWLRSPEFADRAQRLGEFFRFQATLTPRLKELAILFTARYWAAQLEWWAHSRMAREAGLEQQIIDAIETRERPDFVNDDEEAVYRFCEELYATRRVSDATFRAVEKHVGPRGVTELVGTLGYYVLVSMTLNVFEVDIPDGSPPQLPEY